jgi:hypothetical protein
MDAAPSGAGHRGPRGVARGQPGAPHTSPCGRGMRRAAEPHGDASAPSCALRSPFAALAAFQRALLAHSQRSDLPPAFNGPPPCWKTFSRRSSVRVKLRSRRPLFSGQAALTGFAGEHSSAGSSVRHSHSAGRLRYSCASAVDAMNPLRRRQREATSRPYRHYVRFRTDPRERNIAGVVQFGGCGRGPAASTNSLRR